MMMMITPNSLVRQKERGQGEEEEEVGDQRKGRPTGAPTLGVNAPKGKFGQECRMRETEENMDGGFGLHPIGGEEGARDQSYSLTIGMEGATEG